MIFYYLTSLTRIFQRKDLPVTVNHIAFHTETLLEEWATFNNIMNKGAIQNRMLPEKDDSHDLINDLCDKELRVIKPYFATAVRFSFRFTEY